MSINANGSRQQLKPIVLDGPSPGIDDTSVAYLVKSCGGVLLYIRRYICCVDDVTLTFKVYRMCRNSINNKAKGNLLYWREIKNMGDDALFLGGRHLLCVKASNFPGCKPNAIYFAPHYWEIKYDMGVFNLKDDSMTPLYPYDQSRTCILRPVWVVPTYTWR
ncbi:probable F-box protein At1g44080 [Tripterygium wilfordii]|uniref:probable F-box protein At1g44080 n=1 Tax=Tripterygium wilfordii TaxID=458696 RepID=UPI0018F8577E|nr:probable F-box protein At1g44080 [Tripterygium wilfordii]